jgi:opacity protein-like surface antigen
MNFMKNSILGATIFLSALAGSATAEIPSYSFIESGYAKSETLDGLGFDGSVDISPNFFVSGSYSKLSESDDSALNFEQSFTSFGGGFKQDFNNDSSAYLKTEYILLDYEFLGATVDDNGYEISGGLRSNVASNTEIFGEISHFDIGDTSTEVGIGVRQSFSEQFGLFAEYRMNDMDIENYRLGVSYKF